MKYRLHTADTATNIEAADNPYLPCTLGRKALVVHQLRYA